MAIEIIPKKKRKVKLINYALYLSGALLLISLGSYAFLYYSIESKNQKLSGLEHQLQQKWGDQERTLEAKIKSRRDQIDRFSQLLNSHRSSTKLFELLETSSHPKLMFSSFNLDADLNQVTVSGKTESFKTLGEQLLILKQQNKVRNLTISKVSITEGGKIGFKLVLKLKPELFQY